MDIGSIAPDILTIATPIAVAIAWLFSRADRASDERASRLKSWSEAVEIAQKHGDRLLKEAAMQVGLNVRKVSLGEMEEIGAAYSDDAARVIRIYDLHAVHVRWTKSGFSPRGKYSLEVLATLHVLGYLCSAALSVILGQSLVKTTPASSSEFASIAALAGLSMLLAAVFLLTAIHIWDGRKILALKPTRQQTLSLSPDNKGVTAESTAPPPAAGKGQRGAQQRRRSRDRSQANGKV